MSLLASVLIHTPHIDYTAIMPELICLGGALALLMTGALAVRQIPTVVYTAMSVAISVAALVSSLVLWHVVQLHGPFAAVAKSLAIDGFSVAFVVLATCILIVAAFVADGYLRREEIHGPEYHALALLAASGAMFMAAANDLIVIFLGLEIMSIPLYILAGLDLRRQESGEAAMKYFVLGAFSSAIFVYGIALTYGATGSTNLAEIASFLASNVLTSNGLLLAGLALLLVGFGFKIAAVPFHMWTPDVYQGAPTPATGFMAAIAKVGGFAALLRVFFSSFSTLAIDWKPLLFVVAILTLLTGAVLGLVQRDIKRMLAYSSINHAGFILLGLQAAIASGIAASLYYVFVYAFLVLGSFIVITLMGARGDKVHEIESYRGLGRRQPVLALCFAVLLLAQAGVPFTTGFLAKLYVVEAAVQAHSYALAVLAMLSGAIAAAFYLRVVFLMYGTGAAASEARVAAAMPGGAAAGESELQASSVGPPPLDSESPAMAAGRGGGVAIAATGVATVTAALPAPAFDRQRVEVPLGAQIGLFLTVGFTVVLGIWPAPLFDFVHAAKLLF
ncbi:MAG TPA: NADH-quinone oxidoreductase subunit N [Acidimicrobiales bacterium]|nr:NADH-quinone oxidoreductase subunit N [Acidimicrobiales bacterium]